VRAWKEWKATVTGTRLLLAATCALATSDLAEAGPFDPPPPEVYVRHEDQDRARLLQMPCTTADVGSGCYRSDGRLIRESPCSYHIDARTLGSLPTDQCYKMQRPRRYRGIWINEFEGQQFIPEGVTLPEWPRTNPRSPGWREQFERARAASIWLSVDRAMTDDDVRRTGRRMLIEFIGRQTAYPGNYGHMGMSGNEIIVDRVISLKVLE
jgi:hypothetical protein